MWPKSPGTFNYSVCSSISHCSVSQRSKFSYDVASFPVERCSQPKYVLKLDQIKLDKTTTGRISVQVQRTYKKAVSNQVSKNKKLDVWYMFYGTFYCYKVSFHLPK